MTYPPKTTASLAADYIVFAVYVGFSGFILAVFFVVFALGDYRLSLTEPQLALVTEKTVQQRKMIYRRREVEAGLVNWVDLQLANDAGQMIRFGLSPDDATFAQLVTGQRVLVRFNPSNPLSSVLESEFRAGELGFAGRSSGRWAILALMGSFFIVVWGRAKARRLIGVRDHGIVRNAIVVAQESSIWRGGKGTIGMSAVWRDETERPGRTLWAQVRKGSPAKHLPSVGETIRVYVDAVTPNLSVWEGDVGTRPDPIESR